MASMSLASKLALGGSVLLLIDSFLSWQKVCFDSGLGLITGLGSVCFKRNAWGGNGGLFGVIMALLVIILIAFEVVTAMGMGSKMNLSIPASKLEAYFGFGVLGFTILKVLFVISNESTLFAYLGLVFALVVGYGSWLHFQEPVAASGGGNPPQTSI